ncbi:acetate/propionate family kinase [Bradyrhizobium cosmicum]|uniref:acetate/propionate family kinase n=1 Tax=Bradyrhizobium cosmicum TaxID=1404864 RepID=UPI0028E86D2A|nr:acetate/propionate family kinase [Bradyrhizobium cosmicum]
MDTILVINAGSSHLRFQIYSVEGEGRLRQQLQGRIDGIGRCPRLQASRAAGDPLANRAYPVEAVPDISAALNIAGGWLRDELHISPIAVGHHVVHGGTEHDRSVLIDHGVLARLERLTALAPLHLPHNLAPIRSILVDFPSVPQVACFDTAFHRTHAAVADHYAIPPPLYVEGVRRYGFHGLSYEYIAKTLPMIAPKIALGRVIVARLGSGASMCALSGGRSVESTMGFSALDGLPMGARPGQIDPGVVLYLISEKGMSAQMVQEFLHEDCGLKGLSGGVSGDVRQLEASQDPSAKFAIDYFVYRIGLNAGMLAAALQGLDAFVFTAEVGVNSASIRSRVVEQLAWLGVRLDVVENARKSQLISSAASRIPVYVVPSDEELMIARHTLALLMSGSSRAPSRVC